MHLEDQLVRELTLRQTPRGLEVFAKIFSLLDGGNDSLVDLLLVGSLGFGQGLLRFGLALFEELGLSRTWALGCGFCEISVVDFLVELRKGRGVNCNIR